jgi:uncharacterized Zn finger protein
MSRYDYFGYGFRPYVSVAERRRKATREMAKLARQGKKIQPIVIEGRTIARTFWGSAWCENLESYMDYENRLPRGRTYVRNGSVVHLDIRPGEIEAIVSGSELYRIKIGIAAVVKAKWQALCHECAGSIGSLIELLQGRFSDHVMAVLTRKELGLFPAPAEIKMKCSCPDWATMCKHVAAVLYGVGARLDRNPELLFTLRSVNHEELITQAATAADLAVKTSATATELDDTEISEVFGIELDTQSTAPQPAAAPSPDVTSPTKSGRKPRTEIARAKSSRKPAKKRASRVPRARRQPRKSAGT